MALIPHFLDSTPYDRHPYTQDNIPIIVFCLLPIGIISMQVLLNANNDDDNDDDGNADSEV